MKAAEDKVRRLNDEISSLEDEIKQLVTPQNQPESLVAGLNQKFEENKENKINKI